MGSSPAHANKNNIRRIRTHFLLQRWRAAQGFNLGSGSQPDPSHEVRLEDTISDEFQIPGETMTRPLARVLIIALTLMFGPQLFADTKFDHAELMKAPSAGQKHSGSAVKGTFAIDDAAKTIQFLNAKGEPVLSIKFSDVRTLLYSRAEKPRYTEPFVISPLFLTSYSVKHFLTIQYNDEAGAGQYVIVHLDKKNARQAIAAAEAETGMKVDRELGRR